MKVLYLHQYFHTPEDAGGTRSYYFAKKLVENGHNVTMLTSNKHRPDWPFIKRKNIDGIDIIYIKNYYDNKFGKVRRALSFLKFAFFSSIIAFKQKKVDLVFATSTPLTIGIPALMLKCFKRKRFIFEVRDLWPELPKEMGIIKNPILLWGMSAIEWLSYNLADACIGLSPGIKKGISRRLRNKNKKVEMIPNGCDLDLNLFKKSNSLEKSFFKDKIKNYHENDIICIFTGAHGYANGLDAVLDTAKELKKRKIDYIKFVFIGDGKLKPHLIRRKKNENLTNCIFLEKVSKKELFPILCTADIGLMILKNIPAFYYGTSPNKFFDYISCGLPILNNYPGWLATMIEEHKCGYIAEPDNPVNFANTLVKMASDKKRLTVMGENARRLAEMEFDINILAGNFVNLFESISKQA